MPTPHIINLLRDSHAATIASTERTKLALAVGSVWYNRETKDKAVASVARTCTALSRMDAFSGSPGVAGGVMGSEHLLLQGRGWVGRDSNVVGSKVRVMITVYERMDKATEREGRK